MVLMWFLRVAALVWLPLWAEAQTITLAGVNIIDGTGNAPILGANIVVADGKIRAVGPKSRVKPSGRVLDLGGRYVIPGLFNLHGHVGVTRGVGVSKEFYSENNVIDELQRYLYYGVTAVRSSGIDSDLIFPIRDHSRDSGFMGAHLFTAWRGIAFKNGTPTTTPSLGEIPFQVSTPDEARQRVREIARKRADFIKIWVDDSLGTLPKMHEDVYRAILQEAAAQRIRVSSHSFYQRDIEKMVGYGLNGSIHGIADTTALDPGVLRLLATSNFIYAPTLTAYQSRYIYAEGAEFLSDPALALVFPPDTVRKVQSRDYREQMRGGRDLAGARQQFERAAANVLTLQKAGVRIGLGSDHTPTRFPGYMEHRELELLVQAGLTPMQAIVAGTRNSAEQVGALDWLGTIEVGKHADFMVLEANPLDDIRNTRKILYVFKDGHQVDRETLKKSFLKGAAQ